MIACVNLDVDPAVSLVAYNTVQVIYFTLEQLFCLVSP